MSKITDLLQKEIEKLDPTQYYKEPICMIRVSKEWQGDFRVADRDVKKCEMPGCTPVKGLIKVEA
jgi:hypothetical protein